MTKPAKPTKTTKPETLEIEQLDAAVGGALGAIVPCVKIGIDTSRESKINTFPSTTGYVTRN